jgi:RNA polymerase sigma factor (sigma-70 family)
MAMQGSISSSHRDDTKNQSNPDASLAAFFEEHRPLLSKLVRSATRRNRDADRDDLRQVANIALWQAAASYDGSRGYPFPHYASVCIARALKRAAKAEKAQSPLPVVDIDDLQDKAACDGAEPREGQTSADRQRYFGDAGAGEPYQRCLMNEIAVFVRGLKPQLRDVYHLHMLGGRPQAALARDLGVSQQRVAKIKAELCSHLMELLVAMN